MCIADRFILACSLHSDVAPSITIIVIIIYFLFSDEHVSNLFMFSKQVNVKDARLYYDHHLIFKFFLFFFLIIIKRCCCFSTFWSRSVDNTPLDNRKLNRKYYYSVFCCSCKVMMRQLSASAFSTRTRDVVDLIR